MGDRYRRPDWVRRLNRMADSVAGQAQALVPISPEGLLEAAVAATRTAPRGDFGDPTWHQRFEALVTAVDASPMHLVGRLVTKQELLRSLIARLVLNRTLDDAPGIAAETVEAPLIVTGPARSGTTILFELLALDPALRAPAAWEALHPISLDASATAEARLAWSECEQELWADLQPDFSAIHELRSDLPVECVTLTMPCFSGTHWLMIA
jgi:hypothetical protein